MTATLDEAPAQPAGPPPARRRNVHNWVQVVLVLAGVLVLLYPVLSTQYNNAQQRQFAARYNQDVQAAAPHVLDDALARAHTYNSTLAGVPILDPWLAEVTEPESGPYAQYQSQLSDFDAMARIRVPEANIDLPVRHGTSEQVLATGAGHLYGTSLPVGGEGTHSVITSHSAFSNATLFDHLNKVREGDLMYVDVYGQTLAYQVDQIKVVLPSEIEDLASEPGQDQLTLFTCTPYAVNTHRLLVRGHRVDYNPALDQAPAAEAPALEEWMYPLIGGAVLGLLALVVVVVRSRRARRRARAAAAAAQLGAAQPGPVSPGSVPSGPERSAPEQLSPGAAPPGEQPG